ncbi:hypothetical protein PV797_00755 [Clostridiaceae bacterium M8S5]|nr:hypothetical protein PV797_00755 [Clostridiaceae bacterium M8S5]
MAVKLFILLMISVCVYVVFAVKSFKNIPVDYDIKFIRRIYYCYSLVWIIVFNIMFYDIIKTVQIIRVSAIMSTQFAVNVFIVSTVLFIGCLIWEYLFISCKSIRIFRFKNLALKLEREEREKIKSIAYYGRFVKREKDTLYAVLNAMLEMEEYINQYIKEEDLSPYVCYEKILKEYKSKRKNIDVNVYYENTSQFDLMKRQLGLTEHQLSSIICTMNIFGFCSKDGFRKKDYIFGKIETKYLPENIIVVLRSKHLIDKEFLILFDIINYFELRLELEMLKM